MVDENKTLQGLAAACAFQAAGEGPAQLRASRRPA
jgi:hypothetical protein